MRIFLPHKHSKQPSGLKNDLAHRLSSKKAVLSYNNSHIKGKDKYI